MFDYKPTLTSKVDAHAHLNEQVLQLHELQLAQAGIAEQGTRDDESKKSLEDLEAKNKEIGILEKQLKELEQKLKIAETKLVEKVEKRNPVETEIKSRDIDLGTPNVSRRKKKSQASAAEAPSSSTKTQVQTAQATTSPLMTFKFVMGVALISVIVGIILGKRY